MKLKWKVAPAPTGQFRGFQHRAWPTAEDEKGRPIANIRCMTSYTPRVAKSGNHAPLAIYIAVYVVHKMGFEWRQLKGASETLDEAKSRAEAFVEANQFYFSNKTEE